MLARRRKSKASGITLKVAEMTTNTVQGPICQRKHEAYHKSRWSFEALEMVVIVIVNTVCTLIGNENNHTLQPYICNIIYLFLDKIRQFKDFLATDMGISLFCDEQI